MSNELDLTAKRLRKMRAEANESLNSPTFTDWFYPNEREVIALLDRIDRLTESNRRLANQIVGYGDRVQESVRGIQADAWDIGVKTTNDYLFGPEAPEPVNPYRSTSETI